MEVPMSAIDELLRANAGYAKTFDRRDLPTPPRLKLAIVTCMDSRILPSRAFGLEEGDAHIIRNSGGRAQEALRSLIISQRLLGTREIAVIHHTECGSLLFSNPDLHKKVKQELGADASDIDFLPFTDLQESVREDVSLLVTSPLLSPDTLVRGFIYDVHSGSLTEVQVEAAGVQK
jgi:carbonic anhydrase